MSGKHCSPPKSSGLDRCGDPVEFVCDDGFLSPTYLCRLHVDSHRIPHGEYVKPTATSPTAQRGD